MILVDTSVWVDHFKHDDRRLTGLLLDMQVLCHPFVIGELACGKLRQRGVILELLTNLTQAPTARHEEVLALVGTRKLMGSGIGWIDAHLLASTALAGASLWTKDNALSVQAKRLGIDPGRAI